MHSPEVIQAAQELWNEGKLSRRAIAKKLGISRGSMSSIARGDLKPHPPREPRQADDTSALDTGPIERCPTCGGRVYAPCRLCAVRDWKAKAQTDRRQAADRRAEVEAWKLNPAATPQPDEDRRTRGR